MPYCCHDADAIIIAAAAALRFFAIAAYADYAFATLTLSLLLPLILCRRAAKRLRRYFMPPLMLLLIFAAAAMPCRAMSLLLHTITRLSPITLRRFI